MKVEATVKFEYSISNEEVAKFKSRVRDYIQEEIDWDCDVPLDDIPDSEIEEFLKETIPNLIEESHRGYCGSGVEVDDYFNTIYFDYYGEDVRDMVRDMAHQIYDGIKEV